MSVPAGRPGRAPSRLDPFAPDWLVRILVPRAAPVPWVDALRVAVTIVAPLAVAVAVGQTASGVFAAMGALAGALGDRGGSRTDRVTRALAGVGFAVVGLLAGRATAGDGALPVLVIAALAVVSALVSTVSSTLSFGGLQLLVYTAVASGLPAGPGYDEVVLAFLAGGAFAMLLSFTQTLVVGAPDVERDAVVRVVRAVAGLLRHPAPDPPRGVPDAPGHVAVRRELTDALDAGYDRLLRARAVSPGRRADLQTLTGVLVALSPLVSAAVATARADRPAPDLADLVDALGDAIAADDRDWHPRAAGPAGGAADVTATRSLLREAVLAGVDRAATALVDRTATPASVPGAAGGPERTTPARLLLGGSTWVFAARLALTMAVAEVVRQVVPLERPYWIVLTAALVLKPDFGSVFARGVQRTLGTLVGVVIGAAVVYVVPSGPWVLLPMAVFAAAVPVAMARNYGMFSTFLTPLVLLLLDFGRPVDGAVAQQRLLDTAVGAAVVLVVGYLCWPQTWRPHLARRVAVAAETLGGFTRAAFGPDRPAAGRARRRAYRALSDARQAMQTALSEPPPVSGARRRVVAGGGAARARRRRRDHRDGGRALPRAGTGRGRRRHRRDRPRRPRGRRADAQPTAPGSRSRTAPRSPTPRATSTAPGGCCSARAADRPQRRGSSPAAGTSPAAASSSSVSACVTTSFTAAWRSSSGTSSGGCGPMADASSCALGMFSGP